MTMRYIELHHKKVVKCMCLGTRAALASPMQAGGCCNSDHSDEKALKPKILIALARERF